MIPLTNPQKKLIKAPSFEKYPKKENRPKTRQINAPISRLFGVFFGACGALRLLVPVDLAGVFFFCGIKGSPQIYKMIDKMIAKIPTPQQ